MGEEFVDLDVMLASPVPFVKFKGKNYYITPLSIAEVQEYSKDIIVGPTLLNLGQPKALKAVKKCFEAHVLDDDKNPVKFDATNEWPQEALELFVKKVFKISG